MRQHGQRIRLVAQSIMVLVKKGSSFVSQHAQQLVLKHFLEVCAGAVLLKTWTCSTLSMHWTHIRLFGVLREIELFLLSKFM